MTFREMAAMHAGDLIGTLFYHQGRNPNLEGLDCVGLVLEAYRRAGVELPDRQGYPQHGNADWLEQLVEENCEPIEEAEPGALLLFAHQGSSRARHLALAVSATHMIHARHGQLVREDPIASPVRRQGRKPKLALLGAWRVREAA